MDFGLVSVLFDATIHAASMLGEHGKQKKEKLADSWVATIQLLDAEEVASSVSSVRLASFMRGALSAELLNPVLESPAFRGLIKEMFLAKLTDFGDSAEKNVSLSMVGVVTQQLAGKADEADAQFFADQVVAALAEAIDAILDRVRTARGDSLIGLQQVAVLKRVTAVLENIERHAQAIAVAQEPTIRAEKVRWLATYRTLAERAHGYIVPPDFENNRKIPMADLYVSPRVSIGSTKNYLRGDELDFELFRTSIDRTVLLGDPGGGKSTFTNYLTSFWARSEDGLIPFHLTLREFAKQPTELSVLEYIEQRLSAHYQHAAPPGLVENLLLSGEAVVIFDGLDELIDTTKRRAVTSIVELFGLRFPLAKILVTSRRIGYDQARLDPEIFRAAVISHFVEADVEEYVNKWFASQQEYTKDDASKQARSFILQSETVPDLRANPLMLALMCIIFRGENFIPRNRPAVYEKCATLLFEKWDGHRDIEVPLQARAHVDSALKYVAHWMLVSGSGDAGVKYDQLVREMSEYLHGRAFELQDDAVKAATEFVDFCKGRAWVFSDAGTTAEGEVLFTFTHRTFMEYFAAFHLTRINDTPEKLARSLLPKIAAQEWDVVAQLAVQIEERAVDLGSERALQVMLTEPRKRSLSGRTSVLDFIIRCSGFSTLSPKFVRDLSTTVVNLVIANTNYKFAREDHQATTTWIDLLSISMEANREVVADAHRSAIRAATKSGSQEAKYGALRLIASGLAYSWGTGIAYGPRRGWWELFRELAVEYFDDLVTLADREHFAMTSLLVTGLVEPKKAIASISAMTRDAGETFFGEPRERRLLYLPPLSTILTITSAVDTPEAEKLAVGIAEAFMEQFRSESRVPWDRRYSESRIVFYNLPFSSAHDNVEQVVVDARSLVGLAHAELGGGRYQDQMMKRIPTALRKPIRARSKHQALAANALDDAGLSADVRAFAEKWAAEEVNLFDLEASARRKMRFASMSFEQ